MTTSAYSKRLSVVCPVSDMAGRLDRLQAWLELIDYKSTQVVIVHDIRDEKTGNELKTMISKINSPDLILKEDFFGTAAGARNAALGTCDGEWICFWDSDDKPNYELVLSGLDSSFDVIVGEFSIETPTETKTKVPHGDNDWESLTKMSFNPGLWRMAFQSWVVKDLNFPEIVMGEDQCFLAQLDWDKLKTKYVNTGFYNYYSGWGHQTTSQSASRLPLVESLKFLAQLIKEGKGKERFIRNMASRQFLTLFKSPGIKNKILASIKLIKLSSTPLAFLKQVNSLKEMTFYLLRSQR